ncbi:uncharacterized protein LOC129581301 [Paramacrobiotus metropolitanus]|uniref:uncharacterized protein LOC129581301 n=1 Tax=Paramacrobiotus metropolitanus TaxID=2943436 RepID=UPI002445D773|nr:uncharacterized protein LOC129581301 [Paramacrobiotus metropolitanus]
MHQPSDPVEHQQPLTNRQKAEVARRRNNRAVYPLPPEYFHPPEVVSQPERSSDCSESLNSLPSEVFNLISEDDSDTLADAMSNGSDNNVDNVVPASGDSQDAQSRNDPILKLVDELQKQRRDSNRTECKTAEKLDLLNQANWKTSDRLDHFISGNVETNRKLDRIIDALELLATRRDSSLSENRGRHREDRGGFQREPEQNRTRSPADLRTARNPFCSASSDDVDARETVVYSYDRDNVLRGNIGSNFTAAQQKSQSRQPAVSFRINADNSRQFKPESNLRSTQYDDVYDCSSQYGKHPFELPHVARMDRNSNAMQSQATAHERMYQRTGALLGRTEHSGTHTRSMQYCASVGQPDHSGRGNNSAFLPRGSCRDDSDTDVDADENRDCSRRPREDGRRQPNGVHVRAAATAGLVPNQMVDNLYGILQTQPKCITKIPEFKGDKNERVENFITRYEEVASIYQWTDALMVAGLVSALKSRAADFYDHVRRQYPDKLSWVQWKLRLMEKFYEHDRETVAAQTLTSRYYDPKKESIKDYYQSVMDLITDSGSALAPAMQVHFLINGLRCVPDLFDRVGVSQPQTPASFLIQARNCQRILAMRNSDAQNGISVAVPVFNPGPRQSGGRRNSFSERRPDDSETTEISQHASEANKRPSEASKSPPRAAAPLNVTCFTCGKQGHYSPDCQYYRADPATLPQEVKDFQAQRRPRRSSDRDSGSGSRSSSANGSKNTGRP